MSTQAVYLRGTACPRGSTIATVGNAANTEGNKTADAPRRRTSPCVTLRPLGRQPEFRSSRAALGAPAADSGPTIKKDVIYITLDIGCRNVPRAWMSTALPALCTGKPITAGVVVF
jgi:hypothetical protein